MRSGWALDEICNSDLRVHAVVGTSFGMTEPAAIKRLMDRDASSVRVLDDQKDGAIFHPKMYCFSKARGGSAIIGSMNLTRAAFSKNFELGVHVQLTARERSELLDAWSQWNEQAIEPTQKWLKNYEKIWNKRVKASAISMAAYEDAADSPQRGTHGLTRHEVLNYSWLSYEQMLKSHAEQRDESRDIIFDKYDSYLTTIHLAGPLLNKPLPKPSTTQFRRLTGRRPTAADPPHDCCHLGSMSASGKGISALGTNQALRRKIEQLIPPIQAAKSTEEKLQAAKKLWSAMKKFENISHGMITRFLALARPDSFYSLNNVSIDVLSQIFKTSKSSLMRWDGYADGLQAFWSSPWWRADPPKAKQSRQIWDARVALIDVIAYRPRE
jgi:hypothetical protein